MINCHIFVCAGYLKKINNEIIKPRLLTPVSSPRPAGFLIAVENAMTDINNALAGSKVDLKVTFSNYIRAIAVAYFDKAVAYFNKEIKKKFDSLPVPVPVVQIRVNNRLASCGAKALFDQIYSTTAPAAQIIDLLQNITRAFGFIQQVNNFRCLYYT